MFFYTIIETIEKSLKIERLYHKYRCLLYVNAFFMLQNTHFAEEAVQETFERVINHIHKLDANDEKSAKYFLITVCNNICYDIIKREKNISYIEDFDTDIFVNQAVPTSEAVSNDNISKIKNMIYSMKPIYRDVPLLKIIYEYTTQETAEILNVSENTVSQRFSRARKKLQTLIRKEGLYDEYR